MPPTRQAATAASRQPQARTRLARDAVTAAARAEFLAHGYGSTTIDAISHRADVPVATVYRLFSSKPGILKAVIDVALAGDADAVALADRAPVQQALDDPDPARRIAGFAAYATQVNARIADIYQVLVSAADTDSDAALLLADLAAQRRRGQGLLARSLARSSALHSPLRQRDAADIIHALMSPEMYRLLVRDCGWSRQRHQRWLVDALVDQLLS